MQDKEDNTWLANYYFRTKTIATRRLKELNVMGVKPKYTDRQVKKYTLQDWIQFMGQANSAEMFGCSEASCKSWRYGYRQPSIAQAKVIIKATEGRLDFESIYGSVSEIVEQRD